MVNTDSLAVAHVADAGRPGALRRDGPHRRRARGRTRPIPIDFLDIAGSSCGALLPTGNAVDMIEGVRVTCIDNGMPVVCIRGRATWASPGHESPAELEANAALREPRSRPIRLAAGPLMNLGDVTNKTVPKMSLLSPARHGGAVDTRTFIPHRVHEAIGVFGAVSVATACLVPGSVAAELVAAAGARRSRIRAAGPGRASSRSSTRVGSSRSSSRSDVDDGEVVVERAALLRTARLLMRGDVFVPASVWAGR